MLNVILLFFFISITGCFDSDKNIISFTGEILFIDLEGGFFGIITTSGEQLEPINLLDEYMIDGLHVTGDYVGFEDGVSYHMWGKIVEIVSIQTVFEAACLGLSAPDCYDNLECEAIPYWGESLLECTFDERGFSENCPFVGCRPINSDCPTLQELIETCPEYCSYNSIAIEPTTGCRMCGCQ